MKFILGKKVEMEQVWNDRGDVVPVTIVVAAPGQITQVKTKDTDGYDAVQVGFDIKGKDSKRELTKPKQGHLKDLPAYRHLREVRLDAPAEMKRGDEINVSVFQVGDIVKVTGTSKGKGFQGVVKRHGFAGHPATHGHKDQARMPGSIGAGGVQHVRKGMRMGGRMGGDRISVKNLQIVAIDAEKNILKISGAVPGARKGLLQISVE